MNHSTDAVRLFFGIIEGQSINNLGFSSTTKPLEVQPLVSFEEAVNMADKYDIPFFLLVLERTILSIAKLHSKGALAAYAIAYSLKRSDLAVEMIKLVNLHTSPLELELNDIRMMGLEAWRSLVLAYRSSDMTGGQPYMSTWGPNRILGVTQWPQDGSGWNEIARKFKVRSAQNNQQNRILLSLTF